MGPRLWSLAYNGRVRKLFLLSIVLFATIRYCDGRIQRMSGPHLFDGMDDLPNNRVGLVLGTSEKVRSGRPNLFFQHRMRAAADLYHAGKVERLLVSGDNRTMHYNEPWAMRKALIEAGVDSAHIALDHAGFRTLDSMVRAREVFGQQRFTVISQRFHNERAVYIARRKGIDAIGYNARDVDAYSGFRTRLREKLARVKVFLDLIFGVEPRFLGESVTIE
jgi:SanA protein